MTTEASPCDHALGMAEEDKTTPGEFVRKELAARGWMQSDLAFALGVPVQVVNMIVSGKRGINAEMAKLLAAAFDVSAEFIMQLQAAHELALAPPPDPAVGRMVRLQSAYPVREMIKRGWLDQGAPIEPQMARFFDVTTADEIPHLPHAAKKSSYDEVPPAQLAWLFRARQIAREMVVVQYSEKALRSALARLHNLMIEPEEARHVPRVLADCGVRFVLVECLPGAKIDGACFWLNGSDPVVGMSMRFDRIDNFWFVLRHELEHVLNMDGKSTPMIDAELEGDRAGTSTSLPPEERQANLAASDFCVPTAQLESFVARKHPFYLERDFIGFSKRLGIHPGVAAGQLRNRTQNWKLFPKFLVKIRHAVVPSARVDGWGQVAPTSL